MPKRSKQAMDMIRFSGMPRAFYHVSFAISCPLIQPGTASHPVLVHWFTDSRHASSPRSVALTQLRFASFAAVDSREELHLQDRAHAGRTKKTAARKPPREASLSPALLYGADQSGLKLLRAYCTQHILR